MNNVALVITNIMLLTEAFIAATEKQAAFQLTKAVEQIYKDGKEAGDTPLKTHDRLMSAVKLYDSAESTPPIGTQWQRNEHDRPAVWIDGVYFELSPTDAELRDTTNSIDYIKYLVAKKRWPWAERFIKEIQMEYLAACI